MQQNCFTLQPLYEKKKKWRSKRNSGEMLLQEEKIFQNLNFGMTANLQFNLWTGQLSEM